MTIAEAIAIYLDEEPSLGDVVPCVACGRVECPCERDAEAADEMEDRA